MRHAAIDWRGWLPIRLWRTAEGWRLDWCHFGAQALREPFFSDDVDLALRHPFNQAMRRETSLQALLDGHARQPALAPRAFVFHISRCGSTLLAQMLARLDSHIVLSEPPPLDALLRAHYDDPAIASVQPDALRAMLATYSQPRSGGERHVVIKLDAWNIFELPRLRAVFPDTPCVFLYRHPLEVAVSQLQMPGRHAVPGLLGSSPLALPADEVTGMHRSAYVARIVARLLEAGLESCRRYGALPVNYEELPGAVGGRLAAWLGLDADAAAAAMAGARDHAKRPGEAFQSDRERKRRQADDTLRDAVSAWAMPHYEALETLRLAGCDGSLPAA